MRWIGPLQEVDEAIAMANDTQYGLAAYIFTQSLSRALHVSEAIEAGMVSVNEGILSTAGTHVHTQIKAGPSSGIPQ